MVKILTYELVHMRQWFDSKFLVPRPIVYGKGAVIFRPIIKIQNNHVALYAFAILWLVRGMDNERGCR